MVVRVFKGFDGYGNSQLRSMKSMSKDLIRVGQNSGIIFRLTKFVGGHSCEGYPLVVIDAWDIQWL